MSLTIKLKNNTIYFNDVTYINDYSRTCVIIESNKVKYIFEKSNIESITIYKKILSYR